MAAVGSGRRAPRRGSGSPAGAVRPPKASYDVVTTLAGTGQRGWADGSLDSAALDSPGGACVLPSGSVVVADAANNCLRLVDRVVRTVRTIESGRWLGPASPVITEDGTAVLVCDAGHNKIRLLQIDESVSDGPVEARRDNGATHSTLQHGKIPAEDAVIAGSGRRGCKDGPALTSTFNNPTGMCVMGDGAVLIADSQNHCIRRLARRPGKGLYVTTIAGKPAESGFSDGCGSSARFFRPCQITVDMCGTAIVVDSKNHAIRALHPPVDDDPFCDVWSVTTIAGNGTPGYVDGTEVVAQFNSPTDVTVDLDGFLLVADSGNGSVRCVGSNPNVPLGYRPPAANGRKGPHSATPLSWMGDTDEAGGAADDAASAAMSVTLDSVADSADTRGMNGDITTPVRTNRASGRQTQGKRARSAARSAKRTPSRTVEDVTQDRRVQVLVDDRRAAGASAFSIKVLIDRVREAHRRYAHVQVLAGPPAAAAAPPVGPPPSLSQVRVPTPQSVSSPAGSVVDRAEAAILKREPYLVPFNERYRDGRCADARFRQPRGICVLPTDGCIVVSDTMNHLLRLLVPRSALKAPPTPLKALFSEADLSRAGVGGDEVIEVVDAISLHDRDNDPASDPAGEATAAQRNGPRLETKTAARADKGTRRVPTGMTPHRRSTSASRNRVFGSAAVRASRDVADRDDDWSGFRRPGLGGLGTAVKRSSGTAGGTSSSSARSTAKGKRWAELEAQTQSYGIVRQHHPSFGAAQERSRVVRDLSPARDGGRSSWLGVTNLPHPLSGTVGNARSRSTSPRSGSVSPRFEPTGTRQYERVGTARRPQERSRSRLAAPPGRGRNRAPGMGRRGSKSKQLAVPDFVPIKRDDVGLTRAKAVATATARWPSSGRSSGRSVVPPPPPPAPEPHEAAIAQEAASLARYDAALRQESLSTEELAALAVASERLADAMW